MADEETLGLLRNLKKVITKDSNAKNAEEIESDIMKIAVKVFLSWNAFSTNWNTHFYFEELLLG